MGQLIEVFKKMKTLKIIYYVFLGAIAVIAVLLNFDKRRQVV
ncbi:MAG: hypothetical protein Athens101426_669 [Parcubacteria group bacterium Athens1014_26]|nr:MAG: hypothetical protein Athens101426_669 [Parcubacteria group bacterium Athens1014_26]